MGIYREIFLKSKKEIDKKLASFILQKEAINYLENDLKNDILKEENEIRKEFDKIKCANCGICCRFAVSEFSKEELKFKAQNGDITAKSFIETFTPYPNNAPPDELKKQCGYLPKTGLDKDILNVPQQNKQTKEQNSTENVYFYHCKKVKCKGGKYFCPIYNERPSICRNFPNTPLENLPKTCAYNAWKDGNETRAMFLKALNDIRNFYLGEFKKGK